MLGEKVELRNERSTLARKVRALDILLRYDGSTPTPTALEKREAISEVLTQYWITLVDPPVAMGDFASFVKTKIQSWETEEMIEACTIKSMTQRT